MRMRNLAKLGEGIGALLGYVRFVNLAVWSGWWNGIAPN